MVTSGNVDVLNGKGKKTSDNVIFTYLKTIHRVDSQHESCSCEIFRKKSQCCHVVAMLLFTKVISRPTTLVVRKGPGRRKFFSRALEKDQERKGKKVKRNAQPSQR